MTYLTRLTEDEINTALKPLPEWHLHAGELRAEWRFADFPASMSFVNAVAAAAEQQNHHPDIDIRYNTVRLALISHDAGGITARDVRLATAVSELGRGKR